MPRHFCHGDNEKNPVIFYYSVNFTIKLINMVNKNDQMRTKKVLLDMIELSGFEVYHKFTPFMKERKNTNTIKT
uniref:CSON005152 protein n=1 Tax=Culicoides sonorensis TaxID=179676 RepID=A0A336MPU7_CULSO